MSLEWKGCPAEAPRPVFLSNSSTPEFANGNSEGQALTAPFVSVGSLAAMIVNRVVLLTGRPSPFPEVSARVCGRRSTVYGPSS